MMFRFILVIAMLLAVSACTTLKPIEMPPETLQQKIATENVLESGQRAKIVTNDGKTHKIKVKRVDTEAGVIETDKDAIQIVDIVAVETKDFSLGKTALLAASSYTLLVLIAIAIAPVLVL